MKVGDVVELEGHRWRVFKEDRHVKTVTLLRWGGATEEVAIDDTRVKVLFDPATWPFVTVKVNHKGGPLIDLILTRGSRKPRSLRPYVDWVPSDPSRPGGSIFVSPQLRLKIGEILVAVHTTGVRSRVVITRGFGSMATRVARRATPLGPRELVDYLDGDDFVI